MLVQGEKGAQILVVPELVDHLEFNLTQARVIFLPSRRSLVPHGIICNREAEPAIAQLVREHLQASPARRSCSKLLSNKHCCLGRGGGAVT